MTKNDNKFELIKNELYQLFIAREQQSANFFIHEVQNKLGLLSIIMEDLVEAESPEEIQQEIQALQKGMLNFKESMEFLGESFPKESKGESSFPKILVGAIKRKLSKFHQIKVQVPKAKNPIEGDLEEFLEKAKLSEPFWALQILSCILDHTLNQMKTDQSNKVLEWDISCDENKIKVQFNISIQSDVYKIEKDILNLDLKEKHHHQIIDEDDGVSILLNLA